MKYLFLTIAIFGLTSSTFAQSKVFNFWVFEGFFSGDSVDLSQKHQHPVTSINILRNNTFEINSKSCETLTGKVNVDGNKIAFSSLRKIKNCPDSRKINQFVRKLQKTDSYLQEEQPVLILMKGSKKTMQFENYR